MTEPFAAAAPNLTAAPEPKIPRQTLEELAIDAASTDGLDEEIALSFGIAARRITERTLADVAGALTTVLQSLYKSQDKVTIDHIEDRALKAIKSVDLGQVVKDARPKPEKPASATPAATQAPATEVKRGPGRPPLPKGGK